MPNFYANIRIVHCNIDAMMPNFSFAKVLTEGTPGTDTVTSQKIRPVNLTEGAVGTDTILKSIARALTEGAAGVDTVLKASARLLTEGIPGTDTISKISVHAISLVEGLVGTDTIKVFLNGSSVIWSHIQKASAATWTKISRATTIWTHIDHS